MGRIAQITDPMRSTISYTYDASGNQLTKTTTRTTPAGTDTLVWAFTYDRLGQLTQM